jgi:SPP1 family predicted phage head-tail adaptor
VSRDLPMIGSLTDRVALARKVDVSEPEGGTLITYVPVTSLWARVRALSARASSQAEARGARQSHDIVVRFRTDIAPGDRFSWRGRRLDVLGTEDPDGRRAWLACRCEETGVTG